MDVENLGEEFIYSDRYRQGPLLLDIIFAQNLPVPEKVKILDSIFRISDDNLGEELKIMETWEKTLNDMNWAAQSRIQEEQQKRLEAEQKSIEAEKETVAANQRAAAANQRAAAAAERAVSAEAEVQRLHAYMKASGLAWPEQ